MALVRDSPGRGTPLMIIYFDIIYSTIPLREADVCKGGGARVVYLEEAWHKLSSRQV